MPHTRRSSNPKFWASNKFKLLTDKNIASFRLQQQQQQQHRRSRRRRRRRRRSNKSKRTFCAFFCASLFLVSLRKAFKPRNFKFINKQKNINNNTTQKSTTKSIEKQQRKKERKEEAVRKSFREKRLSRQLLGRRLEGIFLHQETLVYPR